MLRRLVERPDAPESAVERLAELRGRTDPRGAVTLLAELPPRPPALGGHRPGPAGARPGVPVPSSPTRSWPTGCWSARRRCSPSRWRRTGPGSSCTGRPGRTSRAARGAAGGRRALRGAGEDLAPPPRRSPTLESVAAAADRSEDALAALAQLRTTLEAAGRLRAAAPPSAAGRDLLLSARERRARGGGRAGPRLRARSRRATAAPAGDARRAAGRPPGPRRLARARGSPPARAEARARRAGAGRRAAGRPARPTTPRPRRSCATRWPRCRGTPAAESLLVQLLERSGRGADLAAYYLDAARSRPEAAARAQLLRRAARAVPRARPFRAGAGCAGGGARLRPRRRLGDRRAGGPPRLAEGREADAAPYRCPAPPRRPVPSRLTPATPPGSQSAGDVVALARLEAARAERQVGAEAARSWLQAAAAFRAGGREDDARAAEDAAFGQAPELDAAFAARRARVEGDPRALAQLLAQRARAVSTEAPALLAERAELLTRSGEALLAAEAWDELLRASPTTSGPSSRVESWPPRRGARRLPSPTTGARCSRPGPAHRAAHPPAAPARPRRPRRRGAARRGRCAGGGGGRRPGRRARPRSALPPRRGARPPAGSGRACSGPRSAWRASPVRTRPRRSTAGPRRWWRTPVEALEALLPLAELHPGEAPVVDRALAGLRALGRTAELAALLERAAEASGGPRAAALLTEAATLAPTSPRRSRASPWWSVPSGPTRATSRRSRRWPTPTGAGARSRRCSRCSVALVAAPPG